MAITYNVLNLQQTLSQGGTAVATYSWLADGTKCAVVDNTTNGFDYLGSLKYTRNGSTRTLESTDFGGGRVVYSGGVYNRYYYITDHLGSVRVITDNSGTVQEQNDYYPFGGRHANSNYGQLSANKQKFNGKELQTSGFLDYGARMYDDVIGRWGVVDPLAEKYYSITPFSYCNGNPIRFIDPDGKDFWDFISGVGKGIANSAISTVQGIVQASQVSPAISSIAAVASIVADPKGVANNIKDVISNTVQEVINDKSGEKAGELVGNIAFTVGTSIAGTKGLDKLVKLGSAAEITNVAARTGTGLVDDAARVLSKGDYLRIQNAATRINKPITVVGSRASGTAKAASDWDYVIPEINSREWSTIKNSLPGARSVLDNTPRNIDIFKGPLDKTKPHIIINAKP